MQTRRLGKDADVIAPDGSEVRILAAASRGSMAHFTLPPGAVSKAIRHRTVEEIWFILAGRGRMWRAGDDAEEITELVPGLSLTIPTGTRFQFRCDGDAPLAAVGVTMPPWPGAEEAVFVTGPWQPTQ
ncbi:MAG: cupin domain-containing protein [Acidobacteriia bacterium]|nr:cupin domain-containing protein [Methyloceanibacter sp.]MCL6491327.1 cupin domain-containing protein [Terriglobia bacterium]